MFKNMKLNLEKTRLEDIGKLKDMNSILAEEKRQRGTGFSTNTSYIRKKPNNQGIIVPTQFPSRMFKKNFLKKVSQNSQKDSSKSNSIHKQSPLKNITEEQLEFNQVKENQKKTDRYNKPIIISKRKKLEKKKYCSKVSKDFENIYFDNNRRLRKNLRSTSKQPFMKTNCIRAKTSQFYKLRRQATPACSSGITPIRSSKLIGSETPNLNPIVEKTKLSMQKPPAKTARLSMKHFNFNCNDDLHHTRFKSSLLVPKLALENINDNNFQTEFLSKAEEFSNSWRDALSDLRFK